MTDSATLIWPIIRALNNFCQLSNNMTRQLTGSVILEYDKSDRHALQLSDRTQLDHSELVYSWFSFRLVISIKGFANKGYFSSRWYALGNLLLITEECEDQ